MSVGSEHRAPSAPRGEKREHAARIEYQRTLEWLYALQAAKGMDFKLERVALALQRLGDPHRRFSSVHIAGTNGKGSVAAMVHAALVAGGHRAALYTSPHLLRLTERIRVGDEEVAPSDVVRLAAEVRGVATGTGTELTFFEFLTVVAFLHFARQQADVAVVEVGLGGRSGRDERHRSDGFGDHIDRPRPHRVAGRLATRRRGGEGGHHQAGPARSARRDRCRGRGGSQRPGGAPGRAGNRLGGPVHRSRRRYDRLSGARMEPAASGAGVARRLPATQRGDCGDLPGGRAGLRSGHGGGRAKWSGVGALARTVRDSVDTAGANDRRWCAQPRRDARPGPRAGAGAGRAQPSCRLRGDEGQGLEADDRAAGSSVPERHHNRGDVAAGTGPAVLADAFRAHCPAASEPDPERAWRRGRAQAGSGDVVLVTGSLFLVGAVYPLCLADVETSPEPRGSFRP